MDVEAFKQTALETLKPVTSYVNTLLRGYEPWQIVALTIVTLVAVRVLRAVVSALQEHGLKNAVILLGLKFVKALPGGQGQIDKERGKMLEQMKQVILGKQTQEDHFLSLPDQGMASQELFTLLQTWQGKEQAKWKTGQASGVVYHGDDKLMEVLNRAYSMFCLTNPLHPDVFPYIRKMEAEVVRVSLNLLHGDEKSVGTMTSGGTESILMACKAYRDLGRSRGIQTPEIIVPLTAHAAFNKASAYFGFKLVTIPVDQKTFRADIAATKKAINKNTIALVGSAPAFPQGCMDPITELAALAKRYNLGLHVDCCLGGFLLPFLPELGYKIPPFDFSIPEVTSISADPHKYGFAPKGCSVVLYRDASLRHLQYFVEVNWPGGIYASPSMAGSRPGGLIAGCWTALMYTGRAGYLKCAKAIMDTTNIIREGVQQSVPEVSLMGEPEMSILAFAANPQTAPKLDIYQVGEAMSKRHWNLNTLQYPRSFHICVTYMHRNNGQKFVEDLRAAVDETMASPNKFKEGTAAMYGMAETFADRSLVSSLTKDFLDVLYTA